MVQLQATTEFILPPTGFWNLAQVTGATYFDGFPNWNRSEHTQLIKLSLLVGHPENSRLTVNKEAFQNLKLSILDHGLEKPVLLCRASELRNDQGRILSGHRRVEGAIQIALEKGLSLENVLVPCKIHRAVELTPREQLEYILRKNLGREQQNPISLAKQFKTYQDSNGASTKSMAAMFGLSEKQLMWHLELLNLPKYIQDHVEKRKISAAIAHELHNFKGTEKELENFVGQIIEHRLPVETVRRTIGRESAKREKNKAAPTSATPRALPLSLKDLLKEETTPSNQPDKQRAVIDSPELCTNTTKSPFRDVFVKAGIFDEAGNVTETAQRILGVSVSISDLKSFNLDPSPRTIELAICRRNGEHHRNFNKNSVAPFIDVLSLWLESHETLLSRLPRNPKAKYNSMIKLNLDYKELDPEIDKYDLVAVEDWTKVQLSQIDNFICSPFKLLTNLHQADLNATVRQRMGLFLDDTLLNNLGLKIDPAFINAFKKWGDSNFPDSLTTRFDGPIQMLDISELLDFLESQLASYTRMDAPSTGKGFIPFCSNGTQQVDKASGLEDLKTLLSAANFINRVSQKIFTEFARTSI